MESCQDSAIISICRVGLLLASRVRCCDPSSQPWLILLVLLDLIILALPLKQLYGLELSLQKRISIMLMFAVGWFACVIAIIRLKYLVQFRNTDNPTCEYHAKDTFLY